jgi:uncharacterized protein (TIGR01244 family)
MTLLKAFVAAVLIGAIGIIALSVVSRDGSDSAIAGVNAGRPLLNDVRVREQVGLNEVPSLKGEGVRTIINLRPDGESADQPPSSAVEAAARAAGMGYAYIPTPRGDIPESVVTELGRVLASAEHPVVIYCRSGQRAARSWALAEASRSGGAQATEIASVVQKAGHSVDDLGAQIASRIAARSQTAKAD